MKPESARCKCLHCRKLFTPDYRNRGRQKHCSSPACQAVRQQANQQRWLSRPENRDYFRGPDNVRHVQQWRAEHPGYWKRQPRSPAVRYKSPARRKRLSLKRLPPRCRRRPQPLRYKSSAPSKPLCWWA